MVYLHHTYLLVTPSASFGYFIRIFFTNNTVFFTESYGHFMQINRIFAVIQPSFQTKKQAGKQIGSFYKQMTEERLITEHYDKSNHLLI